MCHFGDYYNIFSEINRQCVIDRLFALRRWPTNMMFLMIHVQTAWRSRGPPGLILGPQFNGKRSPRKHVVKRSARQNCVINNTQNTAHTESHTINSLLLMFLFFLAHCSVID